MFRKLFSLLMLSLFLILPLYGKDIPGINFYLELDQMLSLKIGAEYSFSEKWGIRGSFGTSPLGLTTFTYSFMGVYHFSSPDDTWQFDLEWGLPLAYFNFIEGRYADWDPIIDDPFHGYLFGFSLLIGYRASECLWGLRIGGSIWIENQRDTGWKGPRFIPVVSLLYDF